MQLYAGLDLHSRNTYIGIMDKQFKRVFGKRIPNKLPLIFKTLNPFQDQLNCIVVESTFNWYWLGNTYGVISLRHREIYLQVAFDEDFHQMRPNRGRKSQHMSDLRC